MARLLQKVVGLIAAYAIALQALLTGVLTATHVNVDPFSIICTGDPSGHSGGLPQHADHDCGACVLTCGASPALTPSNATVLLVAFPGEGRQPALWFEPLSSPSRHTPQASRAPPSLV